MKILHPPQVKPRWPEAGNGSLAGLVLSCCCFLVIAGTSFAIGGETSPDQKREELEKEDSINTAASPLHKPGSSLQSRSRTSDAQSSEARTKDGKDASVNDEASRYVDSITSNSEHFIWGEGIANIGTDLGDAKIKAKDRALQDLSKKISVSVRSEITDVLAANTRQIVQDELVEKTSTYTEMIVTDVIQRDFIDYPLKGTITCIAHILRSAYEQKVKNDLEAKKAMVRSAVRNADVEYGNRNYMAALNGWLTAREYCSDFFGKLPLQDDLNSDGRTEEVVSYIQGKVNALFGGLLLCFLNDTIVYDIHGKPSRQPIVLVQYRDPSGAKHPVANAPLSISYVDGRVIPLGAVTGAYGQAVINLDKVDASSEKVRIVASVDTKAVKGLEDFKLPAVQSDPFAMNRVRAVAVSVIFRNAGEERVPEEVQNTINAALLNRKLTTVQTRVPAQTPLPDAELEKAAASNADFLLVVAFDGRSSSGVGGYATMFAASCTGSVTLYDLKQKQMLATEQLPSAQGFGTTASGAGFDAFAKVKKAALSSAVNVMEKLP